MIQLIHGDCLEEMKKIPDGSVDLVLTDPPYGMNYVRHTKERKFGKIENDNGLDWLPDTLDNVKRIIRGNGHVYMFCSWHNIDVFKAEFAKRFHIKNILVWDKGGNGMGDLRTDYGNIHELVIFGCKHKKGQKQLNGKRLPNILRHGRSGNKLHPTEKPIDLMSMLVEKSSDNDDTVLDCFMGSGTTGVACKNLNRNFIGIELDKNYFEIAKKRIEETPERLL